MFESGVKLLAYCLLVGACTAAVGKLGSMATGTTTISGVPTDKNPKNVFSAVAKGLEGHLENAVLTLSVIDENGETNVVSQAAYPGGSKPTITMAP